MESVSKKLFIESIKAFLEDRTVEWNEQIGMQDWSELFRLASEQNALPMVYESVYGSRVYRESEVPFGAVIKNRVRQQVVLQVMRTEEFLEVYRTLLQRGLQPIVVKGIVCRYLYPNSDCRISGDEDLYIPRGTYAEHHKALLDAGMEVAEWEASDRDSRHVVTYVKKGGVLRIELHKDLFEPDSQIYTGINEQFAGAFTNSMVMDIEGVAVRTMGCSDHLLFLILHAFKHFINSGFGIRQVCDIIVYADTYGDKIDWKRVFKECQRTHTEVFAAALFDIGHRYFEFDIEKSGYPREWQRLAVDSEDLFEDLLSAGIYGSANMSRKHSSNITLNAVTAEKQGKKAKGSVVKTIFLPRKNLEARYYYLKKYPFLLPIAWIDRIAGYMKETRGKNINNNATESIRIGNQRIELMKKYKII